MLLKAEDYKINKMTCPRCAKKSKGKPFCWICLHQWKTSGEVFCGNIECGIESVNTLLKECKTKELTDWGVTIPIYRACPKCNTIIEHVGGC